MDILTLAKLARIEKKVDEILLLLKPRWPQAAPSDKPSVPAPYPDLPISKRFTARYLDEKARFFGAEVVRRALSVIQDGVARGRYKAMTDGRQYGLLNSLLKSLSEEEDMGRDMRAKEAALIAMLREGEPFMVGDKRVSYDQASRLWRFDGRQATTLANPEQFVKVLASRATWNIRPASEGAKETMKRYQMFTTKPREEGPEHAPESQESKGD